MAGFSVVTTDWLKACRRKALEPLLALYDDYATQTCVCDRRTVMEGKQALRAYWIEQFKTRTVSDLVGLQSEGDGGSVSYRTNDGVVRARLLLNEEGKIAHVTCGFENVQITH